MEKVFHHENSGRRPAIWLSLALAAGLIGVALARGAPYYVILILGLFAAAVVYHLLVQAKSGVSIADGRLILWQGSNKTDIALVEIEYVEFHESSDTMWITIVAREGTRHMIPGTEQPYSKLLLQELEKRSVRVVVL